MAYSNKFGHMVVTNGNKSEVSVGYSTLYGDMCGGFSVVKDIYKSDFRASRFSSQLSSSQVSKNLKPQD